MKNMNLRGKLIFYCYAVITPILLIISAILVVKNYEETRADKNLMQEQSAKSLEDSMDVLRSDMQNICTYLCVNEDVTSILRSGNAKQLNQNFQLWTDEAPMNIILDMIALKGYIKTIAIYPENGVHPYLRCLDSASYISDVGQMRESSYYEKAKEATGGILFSTVGKGRSEVYQTNRADKIILYREIYDISRKNKLGFLVLGANADRFNELCKNAVQSGEEEILVLSPQGEPLFTYGEDVSEITKRLTADLSWKEAKRVNGVAVLGNYEVFWAQNEKNSLIVCKIVPRLCVGTLLKESVGTPLILLAVLLLGLCPVFLFLSNVVTKPLKRLTIAMGKFQKGDFTQKIPVESQDELGIVANCFNVMVQDIKDLIDTNYVIALKEKESELNALQAQINPHFLYNTLDALYWRAIDCENEEIAEDILALSDLFRMVLGQGKAMLLVREEKRLIETYLHIQKMRFSRRFEYEITMEKEIEEAIIPKLILQPFVENAIVHGFENTNDTCKLTVTGRKSEKVGKDYLEFTIQDTGQGMTKKQISDIWNMEEAKRYRSQRVGHYAINNVKERLELKYHEDFLLQIESAEGKGTTVRIRIPYEEERGVVQ